MGRIGSSRYLPLTRSVRTTLRQDTQDPSRTQVTGRIGSSSGGSKTEALGQHFHGRGYANTGGCRPNSYTSWPPPLASAAPSKKSIYVDAGGGGWPNVTGAGGVANPWDT